MHIQAAKGFLISISMMKKSDIILLTYNPKLIDIFSFKFQIKIP